MKIGRKFAFVIIIYSFLNFIIMKTLLKESITTKNVTKASLKKDAKALINNAVNRPEKLVQIYFETNLDNYLYEKLKHIKTNGIENLLYCFEERDATKMVSFLRKVFDLPYFSKSLKGLTPSLFIDILIDLCTTKDGQAKKIKFVRVTEKQLTSFCPRPDEFEIEVKFDTSIINMIFKAYI